MWPIGLRSVVMILTIGRKHKYHKETIEVLLKATKKVGLQMFRSQN
jgi:hypothetical protein